MVYLDNAATTFPKPQMVTKAILNSIIRQGANPGRSGHKMSIETAMQVYNCRDTISNFFGAHGPEDVIFTLNCTMAINMVIKGLLKPDDHVIISCLEHNAVVRPLNALKKFGITYTVAQVYPCNNDATLDSFRKAINDKTSLIICTHASNVWGIRLPIARITALAHEYNIPVLVDAAQSAGHLPIDMKELKIDYLCAAGHKGLYGPMGTGILITNKGKNLTTIIEGGTGTNSQSYMQPEMSPEKFESGTPNVPGIIGLNAGINFIKKTKIERISTHEYNIINYLYNKLSCMDNIILYMPKPDPKHFVPLLSFNIKGMSSEKVAAYLDKNNIYVRAGLHCAPLAHQFANTIDSGAVRICPSFFTKLSDIDLLLLSIKKLTSNS